MCRDNAKRVAFIVLEFHHGLIGRLEVGRVKGLLVSPCELPEGETYVLAVVYTVAELFAHEHVFVFRVIQRDEFRFLTPLQDKGAYLVVQVKQVPGSPGATAGIGNGSPAHRVV